MVFDILVVSSVCVAVFLSHSVCHFDYVAVVVVMLCISHSMIQWSLLWWWSLIVCGAALYLSLYDTVVPAVVVVTHCVWWCSVSVTL